LAANAVILRGPRSKTLLVIEHEMRATPNSTLFCSVPKLGIIAGHSLPWYEFVQYLTHLIRAQCTIIDIFL